MNHMKSTFLLLFSSIVILAQEPIEKPPKWEYDGFSYADFGTGEEHSYFSVLKELNPKLHVELRGFYDSYRTSDVLDISYRLRWRPTKKIFLFSGIGLQRQRDKRGRAPLTPARILYGVGFEPKKNINIEADYGLNYNVNNAGLDIPPNIISIKAKYRF